MQACLVRRLLGPAVLMLAAWPALAQQPAVVCGDTRPDAVVAANARLPGLQYSCLALADGQQLFIGRAGAAGQPTVLLVHGLGHNAHRDWADAVDTLATRFQVLTVDLPGFGGSPQAQRPLVFATLGDQLAELLQAVAPGQRVHVVGHSLGAAVSLQLAHRHAAQVERLVLVDAAGILLKPVFVQAIASVRAPRSGFAPLDRLLGFLGDRVNSLGSLLLLGNDDRYDVTPWLMRNPDVRQALLGGMVQADAALSLVEHDFSAAIRETRAPTTVLWGSDDGIAPLRTGRLLAARLPQARLQIIEGAGHTPMQEQPAAFRQLLLAALDGPAPLAAPAPALQPSQGDVVCRNSDGAVYSGRFDSLTLERCGDVRIVQAQIGRLQLNASSAALSDSVVDSADVALSARDSELTATGVLLRGRVAIRAENSFFDLAGTSLRAREQVVELQSRPSRLFLSVSDWQGSDRSGDAHFIWPRADDTRAAR